MQKQNETASRKRKGDTGRTSNQGRKLSSGGNTNKKKGNPEMDEDTKSPLIDQKNENEHKPYGRKKAGV